MKVNKKGLLAVAALAVTTLAFTGCSGGDKPAADKSGGTLTVWIDSNRVDAMKPIAAKFEKEKGVKVDLVVRDFGKINSDLTAQVPTGKGPDIAIGANDGIGALARDGVIAPVELGDAAKDYSKVALDAMTYNGKTYGVPYAVENVAILRNTKLAPNPTPATFDEMIAAGKATGAQYPFLIGLDENNGDPYHMYPFESSFGNEVFTQKSDGSFDASKVALGGTGGTEFAQWLGKQGADGVLRPGLTSDLAKAAFNDGKAPYYLSGAWNLPDAKTAGIEVAVDPIPSAGGQEARPFASVQAFFVSAKSKNALAANEFLVNYIGTKDVQLALYKVGSRVPALTAAADEATKSDPQQAGFAKAGANAIPLPNVPQMGDVWDSWGKAQVAIMKGADPASTWSTMASGLAAKIG